MGETHPWKTPNEMQKGSLAGAIRCPGCASETRSHTTSFVSGSSAACGNLTARDVLHQRCYRR